MGDLMSTILRALGREHHRDPVVVEADTAARARASKRLMEQRLRLARLDANIDVERAAGVKK